MTRGNNNQSSRKNDGLGRCRAGQRGNFLSAGKREERKSLTAGTGSTGCPWRGLPVPTAPRPVHVHHGARTPRAAPACQNLLVKALSLVFVLLPTLQAASKASLWQRLLNLAPLPCCLTMGKEEGLTSESLPFVPTYFKDFFLRLEYSRAGESRSSFPFLKQFPGRPRGPAASTRSCRHRALTEFLRSSESDAWPLTRSEGAFCAPHFFYCLQEEAREGEQRETPSRRLSSLLWVLILFQQRDFLRAVWEQGCSHLSRASPNPGEHLAEWGARPGHSRVWGHILWAAPPRPVCIFSPAAGWGQGGIFFLLFFPPLHLAVSNFPIPCM